MTPVEFRGDLWHQKTRVPALSCDVVCMILRFTALSRPRRRIWQFGAPGRRSRRFLGPARLDRTRPDPRGPARTLSETRTDPTEFLGDPGRKKSPVRSGRTRVVEFSYYTTRQKLLKIQTCRKFCAAIRLVTIRSQFYLLVTNVRRRVAYCL